MVADGRLTTSELEALQSSELLSESLFGVSDTIEDVVSTIEAQISSLDGIISNINSRLYSLNGTKTSSSSITQSISALDGMDADGVIGSVGDIFSSIDTYTSERKTAISEMLGLEKEAFEAQQVLDDGKLDIINDQIDLLNDQKSIILDIREYARGIVSEFGTASNNVDYLGSNYTTALARFNGNSTSSNASSLQDSVSAYLTTAKLQATNSADYNYLVSRTANQVGSAGVVNEGTIGDLLVQQKSFEELTAQSYDYQKRENEEFKKLDEENIEWLEDISDDVNFHSGLLNDQLISHTSQFTTMNSSLVALNAEVKKLREIQESQLSATQSVAENTQESRFVS